MVKIQLEEIIEASDVLVVVHPDFPNGSKPKPELKLLLQEINSRIRQYLDHGKKVYLLSTQKNPANDSRGNVVQIPWPSFRSDYEDKGLEDQLDILQKMLRERTASIEVVGVNWHNCVTRTAHRFSATATINYQCTDYVIDFITASRVGTTITIDEQELIPSPSVLARYDAVIR